MIHYSGFWLFFAGLFAGAVIALLTTRAAGRKDPAKFRRARPTAIYLLLTGCVVCVTASLFTAAAGSGFTPRFLYAAASGFVFGAAGLRFKKAAGLPLLLVCAAACVVGVNAASGWPAARKSEPACRVVVLSLEPETAFSVTVPARAEIIVRVPAADAAESRVATEFLEFPAAYPVFGGLTLSRASAVLSGAARQELFPAGGLSPWEKILLALPGSRLAAFETPFPPLTLFSVFRLYADGAAPPYFTAGD